MKPLFNKDYNRIQEIFKGASDKINELQSIFKKPEPITNGKIEKNVDWLKLAEEKYDSMRVSDEVIQFLDRHLKNGPKDMLALEKRSLCHAR